MELNFLSATFWINFINISFIVCYQRWKKLLKNFKSSKELSKLIISLFCFEVLNCYNKSIINVFFDDKTYCLKIARALLYTLHYLDYLFHFFLTSYWPYRILHTLTNILIVCNVEEIFIAKFFELLFEAVLKYSSFIYYPMGKRFSIVVFTVLRHRYFTKKIIFVRLYITNISFRHI